MLDDLSPPAVNVSRMSIPRFCRPDCWRALPLLLVALAWAGHAVAQADPQRTSAAVLHVGVPALGAPLAYRTDTGEAAGLLIDYWRMVQREFGAVRVSLCSAPADCLADLEAGVLDLAGPMTILGDSKAVAFSDPVLSLPIAAATRSVRDRDARVLQRARVGLLQGEEHGALSPVAGGAKPCNRLGECAPLDRWSPTRVSVVPADDTLGETLGTAIDVLVGPKANLTAALGDTTHVEIVDLWRRWLYLAARRGEDSRLRDVRDALLAISPADLSAIDAFTDAFGGVEALALPLDVPQLSYAEKLFVDRHPAVRLGAAVWEPLTVVEDEKVTGLVIDSVRYHLVRLGVTPVFEVGDWASVRAMADEGLLDGLGYVVSTRDLEDGDYAFTDAVVDAPFVAAVGPSAPFVGAVDEVAGLQVVMQRPYETMLPSVEAAFPGIAVRLVAGPQQALIALEQGDAQVWLEFLPVVRHTVAHLGHDQAKTIRTMGTELFERMATAFDPDLAPLATLMDRSIASPPVGLATVQSRWLDVPPEPGTTRRPGVELALVLLSIVLAGGCVHLIRQRLRERVRLRVSEAALRRAQLLAGVGSLEVPPPYNRVLLTGDTGHLLGLRDGVREQTLDEHLAMFSAEDAARLDQGLEAAWRTGYGNTVALSAGDEKHPRHSHYEFSPPQRTELHPASVIVTLRDVTEQSQQEERERALENEVMELQKLDAIGRLAASIAHDFNNVLSVVMGSAELALRDVPEGHPAHKPLQQVLTAGLRSRELIGQMLNSVRPPARERQRFSLRTVVSDTLGLLSHGIPTNVVLSSELGEEPLFVDGNDVQLRQVVGNLIRNAVDAMPRGGELHVRLSHEQTSLGPRALLRVADTGVGMSEDTIANCFEFFYTTRAEGTGLGLAIVRSLVTAHRGRVEVQSKVGEGSEFKVWLPLAADQRDPTPVSRPAHLVPVEAASDQKSKPTPVPDRPSPAAEPVPKVKSVPNGGEAAPSPAPPHLLLVDDETEMLSAVCSGLRARGFRVTPVVGPEAALEAVDRHRAVYDIVLTDLAMPGMSGIDLARELKRREPRLPIVLMAAGSEDPGALRGSRHIDRVLDKRISDDDLSGVLGELVYGYAAT